MRLIHQPIATAHSPESLMDQLKDAAGAVLLRSGQFASSSARFSFVAANPFLTFCSTGSRCEVAVAGAGQSGRETQFGNPWHVLDVLMSRFELLDELDCPFPLGGAFGYWGYDLKNFTEPKLPRRAINDLELPDCHVGFYDSAVVFDHYLGQTSVISTGLDADGSRNEVKAAEVFRLWEAQLARPAPAVSTSMTRSDAIAAPQSNVSREQFIAAVQRAQEYIRQGDVYQVNLAHRLTARCEATGWALFQRLAAASPAPFAAYLNCQAGGRRFQIASSSPEQFLRLSGSQIVTRPIKGTRPRDADPNRDAQLAFELQTSQKELAELVMITDLLRNDLGKVCDYGSVCVPDLGRLEKFAQVQHLVSTVEGRLRPGLTHFGAFASCFPGGSITGAPKFRAMEIIDELEPVSRGPYCGAIGYLGFNRESQLSIAIRTAVCLEGQVHFSVGAGIVADSNPEAEYAETMAKAGGFMGAVNGQFRESGHCG
jgi:para-aminobenzoate synthetase component 1